MSKQASLRETDAGLREMGDVEVGYDFHIVTCRGYGGTESGSRSRRVGEGFLLRLEAATKPKDLARLL